MLVYHASVSGVSQVVPCNNGRMTDKYKKAVL